MGRLDASGHSRAKIEPKNKDKDSSSNEGPDPMNILIEEMRQLRVDMSQQNTSMKNIIVQLE